MGREARLEISDGRTRHEARVHLDSEQLTIGPPFRVKLSLGGLKEVSASPKGLAVTSSGARFMLAMSEKDAASWAKAMLNPPSLATKLGLKPGLAVATIGAMPREIAAALKPMKPVAATPKEAIAADLVFASVPDGVALTALASLARAMKPGSAAWLIYAKGGAFNGDQLIYAARDAGLKDTKVAKISESHTGLRFIRKAAA